MCVFDQHLLNEEIQILRHQTDVRLEQIEHGSPIAQLLKVIIPSWPKEQRCFPAFRVRACLAEAPILLPTCDEHSPKRTLLRLFR
jgi:hypothetical protein